MEFGKIEIIIISLLLIFITTGFIILTLAFSGIINKYQENTIGDEVIIVDE